MRPMTRCATRATALLLVFLGSCSSSCAKPAAKADNLSLAEQAAAQHDIVAANNRFGFALFQDLFQSPAGKNLWLSPPAIASTLSMTLNGAAGATRSGIAKALFVADRSADTLNRANSALLRNLTFTDPASTFTIANSLWFKNGLKARKAFLAANVHHYGTQVEALDFASPDAPRIINDWARDKTGHMIPTIVGGINPNELLVLLSAVYFKAGWATPFSKDLTRERPFYLLNGEASSRPMMSRSGNFAYFASDDFQAVALPFASDRQSLYLFVPMKPDGLSGLVRQVTQENWAAWMDGFSLKEGDVVLPKFKIDTGGQSLNGALKHLGMGDAFDAQRADFSLLFQEPTKVAISEVVHEVVVEVNEEGAKAAAVTSARAVVVSPSPIQARFAVTADHPFLCIIRDNASGEILFLGAIFDPPAQ